MDWARNARAALTTALTRCVMGLATAARRAVAITPSGKRRSRTSTVAAAAPSTPQRPTRKCAAAVTHFLRFGRPRITSEAGAVWSWSNLLHKDCLPRLLLARFNLDEMGICLIQKGRAGYLTRAAVGILRSPIGAERSQSGGMPGNSHLSHSHLRRYRHPGRVAASVAVPGALGVHRCRT